MFSFKKILKTYDRFFFEVKPTEGIAVFRIFWMTLIFAYYLLDISNIQDFYGPHALVSFKTFLGQFPQEDFNIFHFFKPGYEMTYGLMLVYGISIVFSLVGFYTRTSLIVSFICMVSLHQRNIWAFGQSELLMRTVTFLLIFSPCGHSLSLDAFLGRYFSGFRKRRNWPMWSQRLIQIQISAIYLWSVWQKMRGETWLDGSAVYYLTRLESVKSFSLPFIMDSMPILKIMTWFTLLAELSLGSLIWSEKLRKPVIAFGLFFHLFILFVTGSWIEFYMMALLVNFYSPVEVKAYIAKTTDYVVAQIQESTIDVGVKNRMIKTLRGHL